MAPRYRFHSIVQPLGHLRENYTPAAATAGRYILALETNYGDKLTDTVEVFSGKIGNLGQYTLCVPDTIALRAPDGFINYLWGPGYNLINVGNGVVNVYPKLTLHAGGPFQTYAWSTGDTGPSR